MKFSAKFEYALLTLLHLKCEPDETPISGRIISEELNIPYRFLEQILADLKKGGLVRSTRGYQGGYQINVDPEKISIYDIYEVTEGKFEPWDCTQPNSHDGCGHNLNQCVINHFYTDFKQTLTNLMRGYTLQNLCVSSMKLKAAGEQSAKESSGVTVDAAEQALENALEELKNAPKAT